MDEIKQEDAVINSNAAVEETVNVEDPTTKNIEMDVVVDSIKEETNDAKTTTTAAATTENIEIQEPDDDDAKEKMDTDLGSELKKEEEEEKIEDNEQSETVKPSESGKKKRKKSIKGETATTTETDTATATKRSSRDRKSVEVYDPKIYDKTDKAIQVIDGRGTALKRIPQCKDAIEAAAASSIDDLQTAFKLVFGSKYKLPPKKEMVQHLLDFNGYLPKRDSSLSKEEREKADEEFEVSELHMYYSGAVSISYKKI